VVGTSALGSEIVNAVSNAELTPFTVTGVTSTGEIGTSDQQLSTPPVVGAIGTVIITATVVPLNIAVSDFVDEG